MRKIGRQHRRDCQSGHPDVPGKVGKPREDRARAIREGQVGDRAKSGAENEGDDGHARFQALGKDLGRLAAESKTVERAG